MEPGLSTEPSASTVRFESESTSADTNARAAHHAGERHPEHLVWVVLLILADGEAPRLLAPRPPTLGTQEPHPYQILRIP